MEKKVHLFDNLADPSAYIKNLQAIARKRDWAKNYVDPEKWEGQKVRKDDYLANYQGECA